MRQGVLQFVTFRGRGRGRGRERRHGITFIEVIVGLIVTAMVAVAAFTMLFSTSRGTQSQDDRRQVIMRRFLLSNRLSSVFRMSDRLLAVGNDHLVLWLGDVNGNGQPNISEMQRLEWDNVDLEIWSYAAPAALDPAADTSYELTTNFNNVTRTLAGGATFPGEVWATGVTRFDAATDNDAVVQLAELIHLDLTLSSATVTDTVSIINRLRRAPF